MLMLTEEEGVVNFINGANLASSRTKVRYKRKGQGDALRLIAKYQ